MEIEKLYGLFLANGQKITTDTRKIEKGQMFFALKGGNFDGNQYALEAIRQGASYAVIDDKSLKGQPRLIYVEDVLSTLQNLALYHRRIINVPIIAITGSNGKTTTKELIKEVLAKKFKVAYTKGNLNNHIGIPLTLLDIKVYEDISIVEMGANHQGEIASYCLYTEPNFGLITNIGKAHLEGFGGIEGVIKGKTELYKYIKSKNGKIFINTDDKILVENAIEINQLPYGSDENLPIHGNIVFNDSSFLTVAIKDDAMDLTIHSNLTGDYNLYNILVAYTIGRYFEIKPLDIKSAIESYIPTNSRSQLIQKRKLTIILDAYNANPSSMEVALNNLSTKKGRKIAILGAMKELGSSTETEHKYILNLAQNLNINEIIVIGEEFQRFGKIDKITYFNTTSEAKIWFKKQVWDDEVVLIKGSRGMTLEKILE